ncbi:tripartite tricarboxylate transporter TctB family protein [Natrarchaeobius sp. A-rgal3]|uniref:tripartite tricarboxylate transporter TctB family protein n=1 Tax=Natrarchaeobius versutus TaxID=1679078 RepID=UPI00350F3D8C
MSTDKSGISRADLTSEHVMLAAILAIASYMLIGSYDFSDSAALFPRFTATITIVGVALLLTREYLPSPLYEYVAESTDVLSDYGEEAEDDDTQGTSVNTPSERPIGATTFTVVSLIAYVAGAYVVGLLWVTPLFVLGYTTWFRLSWPVRIALSATAFAIVYAFMAILNVDLHEGFVVTVF